MLTGLISGIFHALPKPIVSLPMRQLSTIFNAAQTTGAVIAGGSWSLIPIRNRMRYHFPRARESKRIKTYGWAKRMSTPEGRRVLMRRILRGRHVLSH